MLSMCGVAPRRTTGIPPIHINIGEMPGSQIDSNSSSSSSSIGACVGGLKTYARHRASRKKQMQPQPHRRTSTKLNNKCTTWSFASRSFGARERSYVRVHSLCLPPSQTRSSPCPRTMARHHHTKSQTNRTQLRHIQRCATLTVKERRLGHTYGGMEFFIIIYTSIHTHSFI